MSRVLGLIISIAYALMLCNSACAQTNSIADVKLLNENDPVHLEGKIVTKSLWHDRFYITEPDRSCGIGVLSSASVADGQVVTLDGNKVTQHGEVYIQLTSPPSGTTIIDPIKALGITSRSFASGLPSTGLPVRVWGKAGAMTSDTYGSYFTLNDGGTISTKVYVGNSGAQAPPLDTTAVVTGISGMYDTASVVLISQQSDILPINGSAVSADTVPEWLWNTTGLARVSFLLSAVQSAITDGASAVEVPVKDVWYAFYPSSVATSGGTYGDGVLLNQLLSYAHSRGIKVIGSILACKDASALSAHTDWRQRPTDSTSWLTAAADTVTGCLVSPYGNYLISEIMEQAQTLGLDGVTLQGYANAQSSAQPFCYCTYCKAKYLADTGGSIPTSVNYDDSNFKRYLLWHDTQIVNHLTSLRAQVRAAKSDFAILGWSANAGEYSQFLASPRISPTSLNSLFDCAMDHPYYDDAKFGLSIIPEFGLKYLSGLTKRSKPWIAEADYTTHSTDTAAGIAGSSLPEAEVQFRMLSALAQGSTIAFSNTDKQYMRASLFNMVKARSAWTYKAVPMKWAAMVVSETTRQYYGRYDPINKYMQNCFGFYRELLEQHMPVDIISESDLEAGLASGYNVLILPNTVCMSSASVTAVRNFVTAGGGLVATGATSLYDEQGTARSDYALSDLFKASKAGNMASLVVYSHVSDSLYGRNQVVFDKLLSRSSHYTSYDGDVFPVTVLSGGTTMATVYTDATGTSSYPIYINNQNTGGGRVAFLPGCVDGAYYRYAYLFEGVLMKDAVNWTASSGPKVTVVGPKSVQATFFTQNNGKRLVIHLLNATNSRSGHANPANDIPARDEVVPVHNIEVWFENVVPTSASLQPENTALALTQQGARTKVIVPVLNQHSMVVANIP